MTSQFYREIEELNFFESRHLSRHSLHTGSLTRSNRSTSLYKKSDTISRNLTAKVKNSSTFFECKVKYFFIKETGSNFKWIRIF